MDSRLARLHRDGRLSVLIDVSQHDHSRVETVFSFKTNNFPIFFQLSPKVRVAESPYGPLRLEFQAP